MKMIINMNAAEYNATAKAINTIGKTFELTDSNAESAVFDELKSHKLIRDGITTDVKVAGREVSCEVSCNASYTLESLALGLKIAEMISPIYNSCKGFIGLLKNTVYSVKNIVHEFSESHETPVEAAITTIYAADNSSCVLQVVKTGDGDAFEVQNAYTGYCNSREQSKALLTLAKAKVMQRPDLVTEEWISYPNMAAAKVAFDRFVDMDRKEEN